MGFPAGRRGTEFGNFTPNNTSLKYPPGGSPPGPPPGPPSRGSPGPLQGPPSPSYGPARPPSTLPRILPSLGQIGDQASGYIL